jgi:hypothetical protein
MMLRRGGARHCHRPLARVLAISFNGFPSRRANQAAGFPPSPGPQAPTRGLCNDLVGFNRLSRCLLCVSAGRLGAPGPGRACCH